jgi:hypothetical protein
MPSNLAAGGGRRILLEARADRPKVGCTTDSGTTTGFDRARTVIGVNDRRREDMKWILVASATIGVSAVAALAAYGGTASQSTLKIVATQHDFGQVDTGKRGLTPGDVSFFSEVLHVDGKTVGSDHIVCTFTGTWPTRTDFCRGLFVLPGGSLVAEGAAAHGPFTVAVVGGSGRYAGARGTMRATPTQNGENLVVSLL